MAELSHAKFIIRGLVDLHRRNSNRPDEAVASKLSLMRVQLLTSRAERLDRVS